MLSTCCGGDRVLVGGVLFTAVGVGAAAGGWWMLLGLVLAAAFTAATVWFPPRRMPLADVVVLTALAVVLARTPVAYISGLPVVCGPALAILVACIVAAGVGFGVWTLRVCCAVLFLAAVAFVLVNVGVGAVASPGSDGSPGGGVLTGLLLVAVFFVADRQASRWVLLGRLGAAVAASLAVSWAALHQLGTVRLGLSPAPLRDALAAADASALDTVLTVVMALAVVAGLMTVFGRIHRARVHNGRPWPATLAAGVVAGAGAMVVPAVWALAAASAVTVAASVYGWLPGKTSG